jgi:hypothetical protein
MALILSGDTGPSFVQAAAMPTGSVIQTVQSYTNAAASASPSTWTAVGASFSISITPTSASNKVLVMFMGGNIDTNAANSQPQITIYRNGTTNLNPYPTGGVSGGPYSFNDFYNGAGRQIGPMNIVYLDSPATTSSTTYSLWWQNQQGAVTMAINTTAATVTMIAMEIKV